MTTRGVWESVLLSGHRQWTVTFNLSPLAPLPLLGGSDIIWLDTHWKRGSSLSSIGGDPTVRTPEEDGVFLFSVQMTSLPCCIVWPKEKTHVVVVNIPSITSSSLLSLGEGQWRQARRCRLTSILSLPTVPAGSCVLAFHPSLLPPSLYSVRSVLARLAWLLSPSVSWWLNR